MNVFVYRADLLCEDCGNATRQQLTRRGEAPPHPEDESSYDSFEFPKGPYLDGGGEADHPCYCRDCDTFLENPLTPDGVAYVRGTHDRHPTDTSREWCEFYGIEQPVPSSHA